MQDKTSSSTGNPGHFSDVSDGSVGAFGYSGSRAKAISDGLLFDVSDVAHDAGFKWPVAFTRNAWNECVKWSDEDSAKQVFQSEKIRMIDILRVCAYTIRMADPEENRMNFEIARVPRDGEALVGSRVTLQIVAHLGDEGRPVLTILLPVSAGEA